MRFSSFSAICLVLIATQAQSEVCLAPGGIAEFGAGVPFDSCQVAGVIKQELGLGPWPISRNSLELGGRDNEPFVIYRIDIGPLELGAATSSDTATQAINAALTEIICLSSDLSGFVRAGGRAGMEVSLLHAANDPLSMHERTPLAAVTVATCEAL